MNSIFGSRKGHHLAKVSVILIIAALIAAMAGCDDTTVPKYDLAMTANPVGGGTATDLTNASPYAAGAGVSIQAAAGSGYRFINWTAPAGTFADADAPQTTFTMPAQDVIVTANFEPSQFHGGTGEADDPYQIADWHQLDYVRNYLDSYFVLVNNLDSTTPGYEELAGPAANGGNGWEPIGSWESPFTGSFDGRRYEIRDLYIDRPDERPAGLFGVDFGIITDTGVVNASVIGIRGVGCLAGWNWEGTVNNSYSTGNVNGTWGIGGLVGANHGHVSNSSFSGSVTGVIDVGGLVGEHGSAGVLGNMGGTLLVGNISDCYASGNVTGNHYVGGLVGHSIDCCASVSNSYSTGNVTGESCVGGLVGDSFGIVTNCYSTGSVTGVEDVGGLVGDNSGTVSNSFWDTETSGQATSDGGTGKTTAEMKSIVTFSDAGWDIIAVAPNETNPSYIWNIVNNVTYPFLSWQAV